MLGQRTGRRDRPVPGTDRPHIIRRDRSERGKVGALVATIRARHLRPANSLSSNRPYSRHRLQQDDAGDQNDAPDQRRSRKSTEVLHALLQIMNGGPQPSASNAYTLALLDP